MTFVQSELTALFAGTIRSFEIGANVFESEPGGFELTACVKRSLVHVMTTVRIPARAEGVD